MIKSIPAPIAGFAASLSALENAADLARIAEATVRGLFVEDETRFFTPAAWATPVCEPVFPGSGPTPAIDFYDLGARNGSVASRPSGGPSAN
jgi:hypothetical protein